MAYGLRVRDSSGNVVWDTDTRVVRIHATVAINSGNQSGSINVPTLNQGSFVYFFVNTTTSFANNPDVSIVGTTVSWSDASAVGVYTGTLFIGTY